MTTVQLANLTSSILGAVGTGLLFFFSYTDLPSGMSFWRTRGNTKNTQQVSEKNQRWKILRMVGFGLLTVSFVIQAGSVFLPTK